MEICIRYACNNVLKKRKKNTKEEKKKNERINGSERERERERRETSIRFRMKIKPKQKEKLETKKLIGAQYLFRSKNVREFVSKKMIFRAAFA